jgi:2',3'-cyclic-nucleotide 2'-phosphodiesterase (5'-nucleotidase family)
VFDFDCTFSTKSISSDNITPTGTATTTNELSSKCTVTLGDINVFVVTNVHSSCNGQPNIYRNIGTSTDDIEDDDENDDDTSTRTIAANYGDILSFVQRMKQYLYQDSNNHNHKDDITTSSTTTVHRMIHHQNDVMNGDWMDGTGWITNDNIQYIVPILEWMQNDVINIGNHEFYKDKYYNV